VNDGEFIEQMVTGNPDILQVVDTDYDEEHILLATIDPSFNPQLEVGLQLRTKSGHEFVLNYDKKFPTLVIPQGAKALYSGCSDIIPKVDNVNIINVGKNYTDPIITIGTGDKKKQIGTATTDSEGKLITASVTEAVLGFVKPIVEDRTGSGTGALLSVVYTYTSPRELRENNVLPLTQYIDCVGHPMIKSSIEDEESASVADTGFNLIDSTVDESTETNTTIATQTQQSLADPVSTPVTPSTPTETPSAPSTPSTPTPPSTPPSSPPQNNPPQQGGYGGY